MLNTSANLFKSAGEDGVVYNFDLRENEPSQKYDKKIENFFVVQSIFFNVYDFDETLQLSLTCHS